jgi:hypothetical protein
MILDHRRDESEPEGNVSATNHISQKMHQHSPCIRSIDAENIDEVQDKLKRAAKDTGVIADLGILHRETHLLPPLSGR